MQLEQGLGNSGPAAAVALREAVVGQAVGSQALDFVKAVLRDALAPGLDRDPSLVQVAGCRLVMNPVGPGQGRDVPSCLVVSEQLGDLRCVQPGLGLSAFAVFEPVNGDFC